MSHGIPRATVERPTTEQDRRRETQKIGEYKGLVDSVNNSVRQHRYTAETLGLTSKLLTSNPEFYTIWNHRRLILQQLFDQNYQKYHSWVAAEHVLSSLISDDLIFLLPLLRKFPKCYWIWNYRLWLLEQTISYLSASKAQGFWKEELTLASKMLSLDSRNFNGWGYRRKVIEALRSFESFDDDESQITITQPEFEYTTKMINSNLSNFSAWHYRSKLITRLLDESHADHKARCSFLDEELELIQRALWTGSDDQSLWFYHQSLMCTFDPKHTQDSMVPELTEEEKMNYLAQETERIREMLDAAEDCKWVYLALINLNTLWNQLAKASIAPAKEIKAWADKLLVLDPLRSNRWRELKESLMSSEAEPTMSPDKL